MTKLYLHIGTHKTGTTSFQKLLKSNEKLLKRDGINVIDHSGLNARDIRNFSYHQNNTQEVKSNLKAHLKKEISNRNDKNILSFEGFSGNVETFYSNRKDVFSLLREAVPNNVQIYIVVFFRSQEEFLQSCYSQLIQAKVDFDRTEFLKPKYREGFDWLSFYKDLKKYFNENILAFPYEKLFIESNPLNQIFGRILDSEVLTNAEIKNRNIGMSYPAMNLFEKLAANINNPVHIKTVRKFLQENFNKGLFTDYALFEPQQKREIIELYRDSNMELNRYLEEGTLVASTERYVSKVTSESEMEIELVKYLLAENHRLKTHINQGLIKRLALKINSYLMHK